MVESRLPSRYRLLEEVGQGGMAVVYRAHDEALAREVAVKLLHPHLLSESESKARLEREARAVARLRHDNILQIFDYSGGDSPQAFLVTEFIDGQTLRQVLTTRKLPVPEIGALIAMEVADALRHAHALGIIHRDVKPENVMVRKDGAIKLTDFGVAQVLELERMTVTGQLLGSPAYMAPELLEAKPFDFRSDVFSVGVVLYQMSTGELPFSGRNPHEVLKRIAEGRFKDPRTLNRLISDSLARVIARALARDPDHRYPSVSAFWEDLRAYVTDAGFEDPRTELRRYFTTPPESYEPEMRARVVRALVTAGRREQDAGRTARALELWNRALTLAPEDAEVHTELRRLEGRQRLRRVGVLAGGAVMLGGLIAGAFYVAREPDVIEPGPLGQPVVSQGPPPRASQEPPRVGRPSPAAAPRPGLERRAPSPRPRDVRPQGTSLAARTSGKTAAKPADLVRLTLGANPGKMEVWLNGEKAFDFGPNKNSIELSWDRVHELTFRNDDCCLPRTYKVGPNEWMPPNRHLPVTLERKLATLTIELDPPQKGAQVIISEPGSDGPNIPAEPGVPISVPFGTDEGSKALEVTVFAGDRTVSRTLTMFPGKPLRHTFKLSKETSAKSDKLDR